jgi:hypothetical protein
MSDYDFHNPIHNRIEEANVNQNVCPQSPDEPTVLVVNVARLRCVLDQWHTDEGLSYEEIADYTDRLILQITTETAPRP